MRHPHKLHTAGVPGRLSVPLAAIALLLLTTIGCSVVSELFEPTPLPTPVIVPTSTQSATVSERWELDRSRVPVRADWPSDGFQQQFEGCGDRGFGGRAGDAFYFIDVPEEPHTPEVVRSAIAEHICFGGKPEYAPPGELSILQGHFTTTELTRWNIQMHEVLDGIEYSTISGSMSHAYSRNRIEVTLIDLFNEYKVRERMEAAGIPQHAVHFEEGGYIEFSAEKRAE